MTIYAASGERGMAAPTGDSGYATFSGEKLDLSKIQFFAELVFMPIPPKAGRLDRIVAFFRNL